MLDLRIWRRVHSNVAFSVPAKRAHDSHLLIACSNRRSWKLFLLFSEILTLAAAKRTVQKPASGNVW